MGPLADIQHTQGIHRKHRQGQQRGTLVALGNPYVGFESIETGNYRLKTAIRELKGIKFRLP